MNIKNRSSVILSQLESTDKINRLLMVEYPVLLQQFNMREKYYEDDFHIIEYYMDKLVCETTIKNKDELIEILGLRTNREVAEVFYNNLLTCNHIVESEQSLSATEWAVNSVRLGKKQVEKTSKRKLYFDAINCKPLPMEFYNNAFRIRSFSEIARNDAYFIHTWNDPNQFELQSAISSLKGEERINYNIPQELIDIDFDYEEYERAADHVKFTPFYIALLKDGSFKTYNAVTLLEETFFKEILTDNPTILEEIYISTGLKKHIDNVANIKEGNSIRILNRKIPVTDENVCKNHSGEFVYTISEVLLNELIEDENQLLLKQIYQFDRICSGDEYLGSIVNLEISETLLDSVEKTLIQMEKIKIGQLENELFEQKIALLRSKRRKGMGKK